MADPGGGADGESDDASPPPRKRAAPADGEESEERCLAPHEREFLRVERLIAAGEFWSKYQAARQAQVYSRFYKLAGATAASGSRQQQLRDQAREAIAPFLDADDEDSDDVRRLRAAAAATQRRPDAEALRRGHRGRGAAEGPAEVVSEKDFGGLWAQLTAKGWKVLDEADRRISHRATRRHLDVVRPRRRRAAGPRRTSGVFQLRSRDAGKIGESIFLDKDDVWVWAVRKGLVARRAAAHAWTLATRTNPRRRRAAARAPRAGAGLS